MKKNIHSKNYKPKSTRFLKIRWGLILVFMIYIAPFYNSMAQELITFTSKHNIPSTPEAALIERFGDIPVGHYTGTANISIPMYSISEGNINIPITLAYHSSGIKVADEATWVGLGWDLTTGGTIIKETRGKNDFRGAGIPSACSSEEIEFRNRIIQTGDYFTLNQIGRSKATTTCIGNDWSTYEDSYCVINSILQGEVEPDIYSYNFGGHTGKFFIDPSSEEVVQIDKQQDIKFIVNQKSITAKTQDGNFFKFEARETSQGASFTDITGYTFKLSEINLVNGRDIYFEYIDEVSQSFYYSESAILNGYASSEIPGVTPHISYIEQNKKTLSKIIAPKVTIDFNLEDREDIINHHSTGPIKRLKSIDISSTQTGNKVKSYEFSYDYFGYNTLATPSHLKSSIASHIDALGKRLRLDAIQEIGYKNGLAVITKPKHEFFYDESNTMPLRVSSAKDFYGYYNGQPNDKLLPDLYYFNYTKDPRYKITNSDGTPRDWNYNYEGANRYTDTSTVTTYMLNKIKYPTGGYTEFDYESNTFNNQFLPNLNQLNSANKSYFCWKDQNFSSSNVEQYHEKFSLTETTRLKFRNVVTHGNPVVNVWNPNADPTAIISQIYNQAYIDFTRTLNGVRTTIKTWRVYDLMTLQEFTDSNFSVEEEILIENPDPTATYLVSVSFPSVSYVYSVSLMAQTNSTLTYHDEGTIDKTESQQCGVRVKSIKNYDNSGALLSHKQFKYYDGKLLNEFEPLAWQYINKKTRNVVTNGISYEYIAFKKRITISSDDFGISGGNQIGYGRVEEIELAVNELNGKTTYQFYNTENKTKKGLPNIPQPRNGLLEKREVYDKNETKLLEEINFYNSVLIPGITYYAIKAKRKAYGDFVPCGNTYNVNNDGSPLQVFYNDDFGPGESVSGSQYLFNAYAIKPYWTTLRTKTVTQYLDGTPVTNTQNFEYNDEGTIDNIKTINSKGEELRTYYKYANDYPDDSPIEYSMVHDYMTGIPLQIDYYNEDLNYLRKKIVFAHDITTHNRKLLKHEYSSSKVQGLVKEITYDSYESNGNIRQATYNNGISLTYLWGYDDLYPIAKIENARFSEVATALGVSEDALEDFNESNLSQINGLRAQKPEWMITTYTHIPLVGMETVTDPKGLTTTYEYDDFNRLKYIKDHNGDILEAYEYNYRTE